MVPAARRRYHKGRKVEDDILGNECDDENKQTRTQTHFDSYTLFSAYIGSAGLIYLLMYALFHSFPSAVKEAGSSKNKFCEERARHHLENITSFGPRVAGSNANEVHAKEYLMKEIQKIEKQHHPSKRMEIDLQITSGSFHLVNFIQTNFYSVYRNMQNIVVKITDQEESDDSFLINCHHDSVSSSPGIQQDQNSVLKICAAELHILSFTTIYSITNVLNI